MPPSRPSRTETADGSATMANGRRPSRSLALKENGNSPPSLQQDQNDSDDSEADTEHLDSSPVKKRPAETSESSDQVFSKRGRISADTPPQSTETAGDHTDDPTGAGAEFEQENTSVDDKSQHAASDKDSKAQPGSGSAEPNGSAVAGKQEPTTSTLVEPTQKQDKTHTSKSRNSDPDATIEHEEDEHDDGNGDQPESPLGPDAHDADESVLAIEPEDSAEADEEVDMKDEDESSNTRTNGETRFGKARIPRARNGRISLLSANVLDNDTGAESGAESTNGIAAATGDEAEDAEDAEDADDGEAEAEGEDEEDSDMQRKRQAAIAFLTDIEIEFAKFRDQLHDDQIARFDLEIRMCNDGTHPELEAVHTSIRDRREERLRRGRLLLDYQMQCIANQTKATRFHIHQQFLKDRFDLRGDLLANTTREWYQVNYERRAADKLVPDFGYRADTNSGASDIPGLVALSKYAGFPAAPSISAVSENELTDDLIALGLR